MSILMRKQLNNLMRYLSLPARHLKLINNVQEVTYDPML